MEWTYDEKRKKVLDPEGNILSGREMCNVLNNATSALSVCYDAFVVIADAMAVIEGVFFGATMPEDETKESNNE